MIVEDLRMVELYDGIGVIFILLYSEFKTVIFNKFYIL